MKIDIPLVNLKRMHDPIRTELDAALKEVIDANHYINGQQVPEFETRFAHYAGVKRVIGVSSGTDALFLALKAIPIENGDYVITVPNTFIATTEAITMAGGRIAFVDADETTSNMSPGKLETFLKNAPPEVRKRIKAVIFVNLYGNPAGLDDVYRITREQGITLISDAAQAHLAEIDGHPIGDFADFSTYSFFPGKNLGAFGDAGALAVNDEKKADIIAMMRNHGREDKYLHSIEAYNCRIDTIQAAVLNVKLKYLKQWTRHRRDVADGYNKLLEKKGCWVPAIGEKYKAVFHLYVTRVREREQVMERLKEAGVASGIHYPVPLHFQPAYRYLEYKKGDFPVSEQLAKEILSLPIDGSLTPGEVEYIVSNLF
ncbi:MAG: DegT/DnrJ/EryC1/StrS family aminotransferase [bacterium]|nr:DegT/DnrJ/EryC1/StrS family aminotransferase [bacterium]